MEFRSTKIVATVGPACDSPKTLEAMIRAGMNVARLNLSHGDAAQHGERVRRIRAAAERVGAHIAIMVDTRGIEIRTGALRNEPVCLNSGESFELRSDELPGDGRGVSVTYSRLGQEVQRGAPVLIDDGALELEVESTDGEVVRCRVIHGGLLQANKSVNLPESRLSISAVSPEKRAEVVQEIKFAVAHQVEYIAASFIQSADDLHRMREILLDEGGEIPIIAKIENRAGVENLEEIIAAADGLMVARGDLGVELPLAEVPGTQKRMIRLTVSAGKPVITATEMLATMEHNPKPTRAEASDVANAILDGTSAVMLSGETAVGEYPVEAVRTMAALAHRAEQHLHEYGYLQRVPPDTANVVTEAVSQAAVTMADQLQAAAVLTLTDTGLTSRMVSKHRPRCPILAVTSSAKVARRLSMNWGVVAVVFTGARADLDKVAFGIDWGRRHDCIKTGDVLVCTSGFGQKAGGTDLIRVITVAD